MSLVKAAEIDDVWMGEKLGVVVDGVKVLLVNVDGTVHAYLDRCAHRAVPLSEGTLEGHVLTCAAHAWTYDACTGRGINPSAAALCPLPIAVRGNEILVDVSSVRSAIRIAMTGCGGT